jgi:hypothetical protein
MRPSMRPSASLRCVLFGALFLAITACNGSSDSTTDTTDVSASTSNTSTAATPTTDSTGSATSTTMSPSTSTTLLSVTTVSSEPGTAPIDNEDFVAVIQGLLDRRDQINAAPDPARAAEVYSGGPRFSTFENQLMNAQQSGQRTVDVDPTIVVSAEVTQVLPSDELGEFVEVKVVQQYPSNWGRIVDASGNTVFDLVPDPLPTEPTVEVRYTLNRPPALGTWLIAFINGK